MYPPATGTNPQPWPGDSIDGPSEAQERERRLDVAIREWLEACEAGRGLDRRDWLERYPDLAPELAEFLETHDAVGWVIDSSVSAEPAGGVRFGPYRIVRVLGKGGMGVVYEVEEESSATGQRLALKVLPACAVTDPEARERFRREAEALSRLDHPGILPILKLDAPAGIPYMLMPRVDGPDLRTVRRRLARARTPASDLDAAADRSQSGSYSIADPDQPDHRTELGGTGSHPRAVAMIGVQAARALDHAHRRGILHRDVKPSNLLLDSQGTVFLTDFGLAAHVDPDQPDLTATGDLAGTIRYLAPERLRGWCDPRSDVYSLGLTLYEMLTLRPAFDHLDRSRLLQAVATTEPPRPCKLKSDIPRDLETIVLSAIAKEPAHRYPTAGELAEDLRRFLGGKPIQARRLSPRQRLWQWAVRHKARTALIIAGLVGLVAVLAGSFQYEHMLRRASEAESRLISADRNAARARLDAVQAERDAARKAEQELHLRNLLLSIEQVRSSTHEAGWREEILRLAAQAAAIRSDPQIRDQVLAAFRGLDARIVTLREGLGSTALAFDRQGRRLLMGGLNPGQGAEQRGRVWDLSSGEIRYSEQAGSGPVAFRDDETPLQLVFQPPDGLLRWDIAHQRSAGRYTLPAAGSPRRTALADDGSLIAAATSMGVTVWDAVTGRILCEPHGPATALAFSPDNQWLATGDDDGRIIVRSISTGATIASVRHRPARILCLSFARDYRRNAQGSSGWLLAAGGTGGSLVVWDLEHQQPRAILRGILFETFALAFNAEGTILVSAGRKEVRIWDVAHGECLLDLHVGAFHHGLALSPDGKHLAESTVKVFWPDDLLLTDLEDGRGFRTLRGVEVPLGYLHITPSGRLVVGITHDFQVGVWDLATGRLRYVRQAPERFLTIGATIAVSPDESRLALCGGSEAQLWDLSTGRTLRRWSLPPGTFDLMDFDPSGRSLLVTRVERRSGTSEPFFNKDPADPNVVNLRDLLGADPARPIREVEVFPEGHIGAPLPAFRAVILHGIERRAEGAEVLVRAYEGRTGKKLWSSRLPLSLSESQAGLAIDPSGSLLGFAFTGAGSRTVLVSTSTGQPVATLDRAATALGLNPHRPGGYFTTRPVGQARGFAVFRNGSGLVAHLGIDDTDPATVTFHRDGRHLLWSGRDGTVTVCDLPELHDPRK